MKHPELTVRLKRHAESEHVAAAAKATVKTFGGRQNHLKLSERGHREAAMLGLVSLERGDVPTRVLSSPAIRAIDTAKGALAAMGLQTPIEIDPRLQEFDWGTWTGQPRSLLNEPRTRADIKRLSRDWSAPGGTSMNNRAESMATVLRELRPFSDQPENIWLVCHRGIIRSFVGRELGYDFDQIEAINPHIVGTTTLVGYGNKWEIVDFDRPTLPADFE